MSFKCFQTSSLSGAKDGFLCLHGSWLSYFRTHDFLCFHRSVITAPAPGPETVRLALLPPCHTCARGLSPQSQASMGRAVVRRR